VDTRENTPVIFRRSRGVRLGCFFWDKATLYRTQSESGKIIYHVRASFQSNHWWSWILLHHNLDFVAAGRVVESLGRTVQEKRREERTIAPFPRVPNTSTQLLILYL
jgi:hypothetical protein